MRSLKAVFAAIALFVMTMPAIGDAQFGFDRQSCCVVETSRPLPAPAAPKASAALSKSKTQVYLFCGLLMGDWCALNDLAEKMRKEGWGAQVYSHLADPDIASASAVKAKKFIVYVGHSRGGDNVLAAKNAKLVFSIDPTIVNHGAQPGVRTYNYYNPWNRWAIICCGGASVKGAVNEVWPKAHIAMASDPALHAVIIRRIKGK